MVCIFDLDPEILDIYYVAGLTTNVFRFKPCLTKFALSFLVRLRFKSCMLDSFSIDAIFCKEVLFRQDLSFNVTSLNKRDVLFWDSDSTGFFNIDG